MAVAGSATITSARHGPFRKYTFAWTASAGGAVTEVALPLPAGWIEQIVFTPTNPTDLYDATMTLGLAGGTDILGGAGANLSGTYPNLIGNDLANLPIAIPAGSYYPTISNAGNATTGTIDVYMRA